MCFKCVVINYQGSGYFQNMFNKYLFRNKNSIIAQYYTQPHIRTYTLTLSLRLIYGFIIYSWVYTLFMEAFIKINKVYLVCSDVLHVVRPHAKVLNLPPYSLSTPSQFIFTGLHTRYISNQLTSELSRC